MGNETTRKGLGSAESSILSAFASEGRTIFTIHELTEKIGSKEKARKMASLLAKKKWLERLSKGAYLILELAAGNKPKWTEDPFYIASKLKPNYYIGYYTMLNFYGWTEQVPETILVATTTLTKNKTILGINFEFITFNKKKFFGFKETNIRGHNIKVSDPEKTIVDALDHPEYCGGIDEVAKALTNANIDWTKAIDYAAKMNNGAIFKRMGYLMETMRLNIPNETIENIHHRITKGYAPLYPGIKSKGKHNTKWNIIINTNFSKEGALA